MPGALGKAVLLEVIVTIVGKLDYNLFKGFTA